MINFLFNQTPLLYWTQSLWRDEAFSVWIADGSLSQIIARTSGDFNPPLYYILLHFWMDIFGKSEIALRSYSLVLFLLFLYVVYVFAQKMFHSYRSALFTTLFAATNPMLIYYAFELRMYSQLVLLSTLSMYFFYTKNWKWYVISSTLGLYTHPFMAFVILSQSLYLVLLKDSKRLITNILTIGLLFLPWVPTLTAQFKQSGPMWIYPVDANLIASVLGNLYTGYEGTPSRLWYVMQLVSLVFVVSGILLLRYKKFLKTTLLLYLWILLPLALVLGASFVKPLYVNRYVIFVSVGEVFLLAALIHHLKPASLQKGLATGLLTITTLANISFAPSFHRKVDLKTTFTKIIPLIRSGDVVYAETPLVYYETLYYRPQQIPVYLYNPHEITPPRYVGSVGMPQEVWAPVYPSFPERAFVIKEDGAFEIVSRLSKK